MNKWPLLLVMASLQAMAGDVVINPSAPSSTRTGYERGVSLNAQVTTLTLGDAVYLGLRNNPAIRSAYLQRVAQKFDLRVAEDVFNPKLTLNSYYRQSRGTADNSRNANLAPNATLLGEYGTRLSMAKGRLEKRLAAQGVNVQWTEFPGGPQLLEGLNVGSIDFGVTGETPPVFAQAAGADLLYVAYEPPAPTSEAILVPKDSPIKSVAELKGKKIVLNKGSNVHYLLVRALEDAGLKYTDVQTVFLPPRCAWALPATPWPPPS